MRAVLVLTHPVRRFEIRETVRHPHEKVMSFYLGPHPRVNAKEAILPPKDEQPGALGI